MAQPLFANQRETNLHSTVALVEEVLRELGTAEPTSDPGALHAWRIAKGSAMARVLLIARPEFTHIRVESTVMTLDAKVDRAALFAHVLELNTRLCGNAFALAGDHLMIVAERSTLDLDRSEIHELIRRVTTNADDHDDALVASFGGTRGAAT